MRLLKLFYGFTLQWVSPRRAVTYWAHSLDLFDGRLIFFIVRKLKMYPVAGFGEGVFLVDPYSVIGRNLLGPRDFEREELRFLKQLMAERAYKVIVDVGANIGLYTVLFGRSTTTERVIAFEPGRATQALLLRNLKLNNVATRVKVERSAVHSSSGTLTFHEHHDNAYSSLTTHGRGTFKKAYKVSTTTLEEFSRTHGLSIDLIKVDVEGSENNVVTGMLNLLKNQSPDILIEIVDSSIDLSLSTTIINCILQFGYFPYIIGRQGPEPFDGKHDNRYQNYFLTKRKID